MKISQEAGVGGWLSRVFYHEYSLFLVLGLCLVCAPMGDGSAEDCVAFKATLPTQPPWGQNLCEGTILGSVIACLFGWGLVFGVTSEKKGVCALWSNNVFTVLPPRRPNMRFTHRTGTQDSQLIDIF